MIHKMTSSQSGQVRVVFELPACVWADQVYLVGDFNEWNEKKTPFHQDRNGVWRAVMDLPTGKRFQFRYLVDGSWSTDYHADGHEENLYHTINSVVDTNSIPLDDEPKEKPSMVHEKFSDPYHEAVREAARRQLPPNRRAA